MYDFFKVITTKSYWKLYFSSRAWKNAPQKIQLVSGVILAIGLLLATFLLVADSEMPVLSFLLFLLVLAVSLSSSMYVLIRLKL